MSPGIYQHYKGGLYDLEEVALLEATGEEMAVYRQSTTGKLFTRPSKEFFGMVETDRGRVSRFSLIPEQKKRLIRAGAIIASPQGKVVVVNQRGSSWSLPKGGVDPHESLLEAMKREVQEETGLTDLTVYGYLGMYERAPMDAKNEDDLSAMNQIHLFAAMSAELPLQPSDPHNPEARWVSPEEMMNLLTHRLDREAFARFWIEAQARFFSSSV